MKGGRSEGEGIVENFIAIESQKNPAPPLSWCQVFFVSVLSKCLPVEGVWGRSGVIEMFLFLLLWGMNGNNNTFPPPPKVIKKDRWVVLDQTLLCSTCRQWV